MAMEQYLYIHLSGGKQAVSAIFGLKKVEYNGVEEDIVSCPVKKHELYCLP